MLGPDDLTYIRECFDEVAPDIEEPITYKRYTGMTAGDPVRGTADTPNYTDLAITASVRELTLEEIQVSGGAYVFGDTEFKIRQTVLAETPAYTDRVIYAGTTYKPKSISRSFLGGVVNWTIRAGKQ